MTDNLSLTPQMGSRVEELFKEQLVNWELAGNNYRDLEQVESRIIGAETGGHFRVQFNPARIRSSAARVDSASIRARPCFLCAQNQPAAQTGLPFEPGYRVLVNPYPIFPRHLTIPHKQHIPQLIKGRILDMMRLAKALPEYALFYNGPRCGASAPDHFHFQAGNKDFLPIYEELDAMEGEVLVESSGVKMWAPELAWRKTLVLEGTDAKEIEVRFSHLHQFLEQMQPNEAEPMLNILCTYGEAGWRLIIFPRKAHRPRQYFAEGDEQIVLSPASVDFGGVLITPRQEDYTKLTSHDVKDIFQQVTLDDESWRELMKRI